MELQSYPFSVNFGTLYWKERAAELHLAGLCVYCGKIQPPTVFDLYCETCKVKRRGSKIRTNNEQK